MTSELHKEAIEEIVKDDPTTLLKPNPDIINLIVVFSEKLLEEDNERTLHDVVYFTTKTILRHPKFRSTVTSMAPAIFTYYLATYKHFIETYAPGTLSEGEIINEAALYIFDIYTDNPHDHTSRRLLEYSSKAIHEVIVNKISHNEDLNFKDVMGRLSTLALLSETVRDYIAGSNRKKNVPYIKFLKTFFETCLVSEDLAFMDNLQILKVISPQIVNRKKVITL